MPKMLDKGQLNRSIAIATLWSIASQVIMRLAQTATGLVYVVLLEPQELGIYFFAMAILGLVYVVIDTGPGQALVQSDEPESSLFDVTFHYIVAIGLIGLIVMASMAPWMSETLESPGAESPTRALSVVILLAALARTHLLIARRRLQFRNTLWIESSTSLGPLFVGIPLALLGFGVWAPTIGLIAGNVVALVVAWSLVDYRPAIWSFDRRVARSVVWFSKWAVPEGMLAWLSTWGAAFFVGYHLSAHETGVYRTSELVPLMIFGVLSTALGPVVLSGMSKLKADPAGAAATLARFNRFVGMAAAPASVGLILLAGAIEALLGEAWDGIAWLIVLQVAGHAVGALLTTFQPYLLSAGLPNVALKFRLVVVALLVPTYVFVIPLGIEPTLWAMLLIRIIVFGVAMAILAGRTAMSPHVFVGEYYRYFAGASLAGGSLWLLATWLPLEPWSSGLIAAIAFVAVFAAYVLYFERQTVAGAVDLIRQR